MLLKKRLNRRYSLIARKAGIVNSIPAIFLFDFSKTTSINICCCIFQVFLFDKRARMVYAPGLFIEDIQSAFIYVLGCTKKLGEVREMAEMKEELLIYIAKLFQEISDECLERNVQADKSVTRLTRPKCPYHLLCDIENNRKEIVLEILKAELFLENLLKARSPRRPPEVSEWMTKQ